MTDLLAQDRPHDPAPEPPGPRGVVRRLLASDLVDHLFAPHGIDRYLELVDPAWVVRGGRPSAPRGRGAATVVPPAADEPTASVHPSAPGGTVTFGCSGLTAAPAGTLLETAEAAGVAPRSRCRRGICGTCTTTKTAGRVRNVLTGEVSGEAPAPIRLCVSEADGDVTLDL